MGTAPDSHKPEMWGFRNILIALLVLGFIGLGAAGGLWYWTRTPEYSLNKAREAMESHDWVTFQKYVDVDAFTAKVVDQGINYALRDADVEDSMRTIIAERGQAVKPQMVAATKEQIQVFVEKGNLDYASVSLPPVLKQKNAAMDMEKKITAGDTSQYKGIDYANTDGNTAVIGIKLFYPKLNANVVMELKMRKLDGYWQLIELNNPEDFIAKLTEIEEKKLKQVNKQVSEQIGQVLAVESVSLSKMYDDAFGITQSSLVTVNFKNTSQKEISEVRGIIRVLDKTNGKTVLNWNVRAGADTKISAQQPRGIVWRRKLNQLIPCDAALLETNYSYLMAGFKVTSVLFADGTKLELTTKLQ